MLNALIFDMVKCLVVDDEPHAHLVLQNFIKRTAGFEIQDHAYHVLEARELLAQKDFDLVFLDINMPDLSGFDLVVSKEYHLPTILTTAYREHALDAFDQGILDYLLKPFSFERFNQAIGRYRWHTVVEEPDAPKTITMKVDGEMRLFAVEDIIYFQSWGNYVKLFTLDDSFICSSTTREVELNLPRDIFVRIHKSYVVNVEYIANFDIDYVTLSNQIYLPVGITYRKLLSGIV